VARIFCHWTAWSAAAVVAGLLSFTAFPLVSTWAADGPFEGFTGTWTGNGTMRPGDGATERIRCNATYRPRGSTAHEVELQLRCASDSYNFDLSGEFAADENGQITGHWTERSRGVGGTAVGKGQGERLQIHVETGGFAADLVLVTHNRRQSVTIDSQGGGQIIKAAISLARS